MVIKIIGENIPRIIILVKKTICKKLKIMIIYFPVILVIEFKNYLSNPYYDKKEEYIIIFIKFCIFNNFIDIFFYNIIIKDSFWFQNI